VKIRWDPKKQGFPGLSGRFILYSDRGQLRVRKWPRKRGTPKSAAVRLQNLWFTNANLLAKHCAASQQVTAIAMAKGTGLYPRDLLLKSMSRGMIAPVTESGRVLEYRRPRVDPVEFQGFTLRLSADLSIGTGGEFAPAWPLPVRDTSGFWDVVTPDRITIPAGVTTMILMAGMQSAGSSTGQLMITITGGSVARNCRLDASLAGEKGVVCLTPPIPVIAGEQYFARYFMATGGVLSGNGATYFGGIILGAT